MAAHDKMKHLVLLSTAVFCCIAHSVVFGEESNSNKEQCSINDDGSQTCTKVIQKNDTSSIDNDDSNSTNENDVDGDKSKYCQIWAFRGECESNPSYMTTNCPISCKNIATGKTSNRNGIDLNEKCSIYANLGECNVNPRYMKQYCAKSCNEQESILQNKRSMHRKFTKEQNRLQYLHSEKCQLYMAESSIPNSGLGMFTAVNINKDDSVFYPEMIVSYFDNPVHAERNILYKKQNEMKESELNTWKLMIEGKVDKNVKCFSWAQEGECDANPRYMLNQCEKSCALIRSGILEGFDHEHNWLPTNYYWDSGRS